MLVCNFDVNTLENMTKVHLPSSLFENSLVSEIVRSQLAEDECNPMIRDFFKTDAQTKMTLNLWLKPEAFDSFDGIGSSFPQSRFAMKLWQGWPGGAESLLLFRPLLGSRKVLSQLGDLKGHQAGKEPSWNGT